MCQGYAFAQVNPPMEPTLAYNCSRLLIGVGAAHNPEVVGSNPAPATKFPQVRELSLTCFLLRVLNRVLKGC